MINGVDFERGALGETVVFLEHFRDLPDVRQSAKVMYPLEKVLLLNLLAVLTGAETFVDIARFGDRKQVYLRRFRLLLSAMPSHDHLGDIFATLDAEQFQRCFVAWVSSLTGVLAEVIAIDGKTSRRSYQKPSRKAAIQMVSAFAARRRLVLGQVKVDKKVNEFTAIFRLLAMMEIEGAIVTIDAMECLRAIARTILDRPIMSWPSKGTRERCTTTSRCSWPSRSPEAYTRARSAGTQPSMATTVVSKPGPLPSSTTSAGSRKSTNSLVCRLSSSSAARVESVTGSSMGPALTSPHCSSQSNSLGQSCEATGPSRTVSIVGVDGLRTTPKSARVSLLYRPALINHGTS